MRPHPDIGALSLRSPAGKSTRPIRPECTLTPAPVWRTSHPSSLRTFAENYSAQRFGTFATQSPQKRTSSGECAISLRVQLHIEFDDFCDAKIAERFGSLFDRVGGGLFPRFLCCYRSAESHSNHVPRLTLHSARGTAGAPLPAISCLGAFRTPAAAARG